MARVLIHLIENQGPIGVWRDNNGSLESYYPRDKHGTWQKRVQNVLEQKLDNVSYDEMFGRLNDKSPYIDHFATLDAEENEPLTAVLYRAKRESFK